MANKQPDMNLVARLPHNTEHSGTANNKVTSDPPAPAPVPTPEVSKEDFDGLKDQVSQINNLLLKKFASSDEESGSSSGEDSPSSEEDGEEKSPRHQEGTKSYEYRDSQIDSLFGENQKEKEREEVEILD